jgi:hypothetical protein
LQVVVARPRLWILSPIIIGLHALPDKLVVDDGRLISFVYPDNTAVHYGLARTDPLGPQAVVAPACFARADRWHDGIEFCRSDDPSGDAFPAYIHLDPSDPGAANDHLIWPIDSAEAAADGWHVPAGASDGQGLFLIPVYVSETQVCYAAVFSIGPAEGLACDVLGVQTIELANPCYSGGGGDVRALWTGEAFLIGLPTNGLFRVWPGGHTDRPTDDIWISGLARVGDTLYLEIRNTLYRSLDRGDTWSELTELPSSTGMYAVNDQLVLSARDVLAYVDETNERIVELDNSGILPNATVTAVAAFGDRVYVGTLGAGLYYRNLADFFTPKPDAP